QTYPQDPAASRGAEGQRPHLSFRPQRNPHWRPPMDPHWNRREFVRSLVGGSAAAGGLCRLPASTAAAREYRFSTLQEADRAAGFDPRSPDTFRVVWAADVHYGIGSGDKILPPLLQEINALEPRPAFLGIAGDLILSASLHFGQVPG